ncbi:MAG: hypothetical protein ACI4W6_07795 [Acutalibacteraceae bacterium]
MADTKKKIDPWNEKEEIFVPRLANCKEQPDLIASVNGRTFQIQRGKKVEVPKPIAEVIKRSLEAEEKADDFYYSSASKEE